MTGSQESTAGNNARGLWFPALRASLTALTAATLVLVVFYLFAFQWIHPSFVPFMDREASKLTATGKHLIPVSIGEYRVEGSSAIIESFNDDEVILALPRAFQAEDYPFIEVHLMPFTRFTRLKVLWRRADDSSKIHALSVNRGFDDTAMRLNMTAAGREYRGAILDLALLFYHGPSLDNESETSAEISVSHIELLPFSTKVMFQQIASDWLTPPLWSGSSNNIVLGSHPSGLVSPNLILTFLAWISASFVLITKSLTSRSRTKAGWSSCGHTIVCIVLLCWSLSEVPHWSGRIEQLADSIIRYGGRAAHQKQLRSNLLCGRVDIDCGKKYNGGET